MNLIRQHAKLKEMWPIMTLPSHRLHQALQCPVFEWNPAPEGRQLSIVEQEFVQQHITTGPTDMPTVAPFPCFRIAREDCFDQWFFDGKQWLLVRCVYPDANDTSEQWFANFYGVNLNDTCAYRGWRNGRDVTRLMMEGGKWNHGDHGEPKAEVRHLMRQMVNTLSYFIFETMLPGNVVLKVSPAPRPSKPVAWHLARTHYLILNHKQAESCRDHRSAPTAQQLVRAAHWRRAHIRRLSSPKFIHKTGQTVRVKRAWVGPDEWIGLDKKIYKVINLQ